MQLYKSVIPLITVLSFITQAQASSLKEDLDITINKAIQEKRIVGTVVLISQNGNEIYRGVYGWSDRELKIPMTYDTAFRFASLTKPIVSVAVLKLVDDKKLNLEDPVTKWLPEFKPKTLDGKTPTITIRNLLTHTAGLNYGFLEPYNGPYHKLGISDGLNNVNFSLNENLKRLAKAPLLFKPGTAWNYSLATDVLGAVISRVEGEPLPEVINKIILKPLAMNHTGFSINRNMPVATPYADYQPEPIRMVDGQAVSFGESAIIFSPSRAMDENAYPSGGAGMIGTAGDYLKFLESLRTGSIALTNDLLKKLTTNQIGDLATISGKGWGWSLGFSILTNPQEAKSPQGQGTYHWGGVWGNSWWVDPINKISVVILTNTTLEGMSGKFPNEIMEDIYKHQYSFQTKSNL